MGRGGSLSPGFNKGRVWPQPREASRLKRSPEDPDFLEVCHFHSLHFFQRSAAWCMRGPQRRGGGGDGSGRGAGVAWVLVRRDSLS